MIFVVSYLFDFKLVINDNQTCGIQSIKSMKIIKQANNHIQEKDT